MKYTPEELYTYCEENELMPGLVKAMHNNGGEFDYMSVEGHFEERSNGLEFIVDEDLQTNNGSTDNHFSYMVDKQNEAGIREYLKKHLYNSNILYATYDNNYQHISFLHSFGDTKEEADDNVHQLALLVFLQVLGIDTKGKLKAVLKKGEEEFEKWKKGQELIRSLQGGNTDD